MNRVFRLRDEKAYRQFLARTSEVQTTICASDREPTEEQEHFAFIEWRNLMLGRIPDLRWLFHVPNGEFRTPKTAHKLSRMGVLAGVSDFIWPMPRGPYKCLFLELKSKQGKLSQSQAAFLTAMDEAGHCVKVAYGWSQARDIVLWYHSLGSPTSFETFLRELRTVSLVQSK